MSDIGTNLREEFRHETKKLLRVFENDRPEYVSAMYSAYSVAIAISIVAIGVFIQGLTFYENFLTVISLGGLIVTNFVIIFGSALIGYLIAYLRRCFTFWDVLENSHKKLVDLKKSMEDLQNRDSDQFQQELDRIKFLLESIEQIINSRILTNVGKTVSRPFLNSIQLVMTIGGKNEYKSKA